MDNNRTLKTDIVIVGTGAAGLYCALHLPQDKDILLLTKSAAEESDSYLAQGGVCVLRGEEDFPGYFEDTMKAGHYENDPRAVEVMIRSSRAVLDDLAGYGVEFDRAADGLDYTREAAHSRPRIVHHQDITGHEITSKLLNAARRLPNARILERTCMTDLITDGEICAGVTAEDSTGPFCIRADYTILATGGLGGLFDSTTNFSHLTGDALAIALRRGVRLKDIDYIQIHPTALYSEKPGRRFLISESLRGEGAVLYDKNGKRFADELLPRDKLTAAIRAQMEQDGRPYVWLSLENIPREKITSHFAGIYQHCLEEGYDITKEYLPVAPAQHYFMGGIDTDTEGRTSLSRLYAVGETSCTGVHGANRLASNSLLECLVFARRAAEDIRAVYRKINGRPMPSAPAKEMEELREEYKRLILSEIERMRQARERRHL